MTTDLGSRSSALEAPDSPQMWLLKKEAACWPPVFAALTEVMPDWVTEGEGGEMAAAAIRRLAGRTAASTNRLTAETMAFEWLEKMGLSNAVNQDQRDALATFCRFVRECDDYRATIKSTEV